jgi:predicted lipoprotein with Yx(FWY)xxD motif
VSAVTYGEIGAYLAGPTRMALYTFDNDSPGSSSCTGDCAAAWPPLTVAMGETPTAAPGVTGELGTIMRSDGTHQVTYNDAPLYYYVGDTQLYDVTGDNIGGVWHLARP